MVKIGQSERRYKLKVFYRERVGRADLIIIKGLARAWASERWDFTTGDPYFYEFEINTRMNNLIPDIKIIVWKCDDTTQILDKWDRIDLRNSLKEHFRDYWWNKRAPLEDIPMTNSLQLARSIAKLLCKKNGSIPEDLQNNLQQYCQNILGPIEF
jgi:hypothetical protein